MDIQTLLLDGITAMTGGLITDVGTLIVGFVLLGFLLLGADILIEKFQEAAQARRENYLMSAAANYYQHRRDHERGSFEYDYYNALYKKSLGASVRMKKP
jgi:hypothetical protein